MSVEPYKAWRRRAMHAFPRDKTHKYVELEDGVLVKAKQRAPRREAKWARNATAGSKHRHCKDAYFLETVAEDDEDEPLDSRHASARSEVKDAVLVYEDYCEVPAPEPKGFFQSMLERFFY